MASYQSRGCTLVPRWSCCGWSARRAAAWLVSYPILEYFRTIRGWTAGGLTEAEAAALRTPLTDDAVAAVPGELSTQDSRIVEMLIRNHEVHIRALVEPSDVGLPIEAMLWITTSPSRVGRIGRALAARPEVRYAVAVAGPHQVVADVCVADTESLHRFITDEAWSREINAVETTLLLAARKRGGRVLPA